MEKMSRADMKTVIQVALCVHACLMAIYPQATEATTRPYISGRDLASEHLLPLNLTRTSLVPVREERDIEGSGDADIPIRDLGSKSMARLEKIETESQLGNKETEANSPEVVKSEEENISNIETISREDVTKETKTLQEQKRVENEDDSYEGSGSVPEEQPKTAAILATDIEDPFKKDIMDFYKEIPGEEISTNSPVTKLGDDNSQDNSLTALTEVSGEFYPVKGEEAETEGSGDTEAPVQPDPILETAVDGNDIEEDAQEVGEVEGSQLDLNVTAENVTAEAPTDYVTEFEFGLDVENETEAETSTTSDYLETEDDAWNETLAETTTAVMETAPETILETSPVTVPDTTTPALLPETTTEIPVENATEVVPENIFEAENTTLDSDPLLMASDEKILLGSNEPKRLGAYIVVGLILLSFLSLIGYIALKKRINKRRKDLERNQENKDTEKALLSLSDYKDHPDAEENNMKNNEITPIVIKQNSQINKFEKNTNFSSPKNLNTTPNEKNIEKDNVLKSTSDNLTQVIIEEPSKEVDEEKIVPNTEKLIVRTHLDQDSIPKKAIIINRTSGGYIPVSQDNVNL